MSDHLGWGLGLFLNLADDQVVERAGDMVVTRPLDTGFTTDIVGSIGFLQVRQLRLVAGSHVLGLAATPRLGWLLRVFQAAAVGRARHTGQRFGSAFERSAEVTASARTGPPSSWPIASASGLMLSGISPAITAVSAGAPPL